MFKKILYKELKGWEKTFLIYAIYVSFVILKYDTAISIGAENQIFVLYILPLLYGGIYTLFFTFFIIKMKEIVITEVPLDIVIYISYLVFALSNTVLSLINIPISLLSFYNILSIVCHLLASIISFIIIYQPLHRYMRDIKTFNKQYVIFVLIYVLIISVTSVLKI